MGCDIHLFVETREPGGPWKLARVERKCSWCKGSGKSVRGEACFGCRRHPGVSLGYYGRNYSTFAILAGVRNGDGTFLAGATFVPISDPRGLPADISTDLQAVIDHRDEDEPYEAYEVRRDRWGCAWIGDHSFSHLGLDELLKYDWKRQTTHEGWVGLEVFREWDEGGRSWPKSWCGDINGGRIRKISNQQMRELVAGGRVEKDEPYDPHADRHYTKVAWTATYADSCRDFHDVFIPALVALGKPTTDVRIVFGFDS